MRGNASSLAVECRQFSRYLIGRDPSAEIMERYARACVKFSDDALRGNQRAYRFARRHPWSLPFLDAGCGVADGTNVLRRRLLIASAILETTTDHADVFLPRTRPLPAAIAITLFHGAKAALKIIVGVPLLLLVKAL